MGVSSMKVDLKALEKLIKSQLPGWDAEAQSDCLAVWGHVGNEETVVLKTFNYVDWGSDETNGAFIIWVLNRLIQLGHDPVMGKRYAKFSVVLDSMGWDVPWDLMEGDTRAEACLVALEEALVRTIPNKTTSG